jgi:hypothetical protein
MYFLPEGDQIIPETCKSCSLFKDKYNLLVISLFKLEPLGHLPWQKNTDLGTWEQVAEKNNLDLRGEKE